MRAVVTALESCVKRREVDVKRRSRWSRTSPDWRIAPEIGADRRWGRQACHGDGPVRFSIRGFGAGPDHHHNKVTDLRRGADIGRGARFLPETTPWRVVCL